jgi:hypothetical protein
MDDPFDPPTSLLKWPPHDTLFVKFTLNKVQRFVSS